MEEHKVKRTEVLQDDFYCENCKGWVYCPEMNGICKDDQGNEIECIGEGCSKQDEKGEFLECPNCGSRYYLED